ncbi:hypothetical protein LY76DRAFT_63049 [Colletotrichum caudatum]|nr:hypothetical protein LY76DRAFT_63049 [Colletotrichum caudatum]
MATWSVVIRRPGIRTASVSGRRVCLGLVTASVMWIKTLLDHELLSIGLYCVPSHDKFASGRVNAHGESKLSFLSQHLECFLSSDLFVRWLSLSFLSDTIPVS